MRNGNYVYPNEELSMTINSSYPTYEEWKPDDMVNERVNQLRFLSYLWGMETYEPEKLTDEQNSSYPTYEEWKQ